MTDIFADTINFPMYSHVPTSFLQQSAFGLATITIRIVNVGINKNQARVEREEMSLADELLADLEEVGDEPDIEEQTQVHLQFIIKLICLLVRYSLCWTCI